MCYIYIFTLYLYICPLTPSPSLVYGPLRCQSDRRKTVSTPIHCYSLTDNPPLTILTYDHV